MAGAFGAHALAPRLGDKAATWVRFPQLQWAEVGWGPLRSRGVAEWTCTGPWTPRNLGHGEPVHDLQRQCVHTSRLSCSPAAGHELNPKRLSTQPR